MSDSPDCHEDQGKEGKVDHEEEDDVEYVEDDVVTLEVTKQVVDEVDAILLVFHLARAEALFDLMHRDQYLRIWEDGAQNAEYKGRYDPMDEALLEHGPLSEVLHGIDIGCIVHFNNRLMAVARNAVCPFGVVLLCSDGGLLVLAGGQHHLLGGDYSFLRTAFGSR